MKAVVDDRHGEDRRAPAPPATRRRPGVNGDRPGRDPRSGAPWVARRKEEQNLAAVDPWTAVHLSIGLAFGLMDVPFRWAAASSLGYELVEQWIEGQEWGRELFETRHPESLRNSVTDTLVFGIGFHLGAAWNRTAEDRSRARGRSRPRPREPVTRRRQRRP